MARMTYERDIRDQALWSFETERFFVGFFADPEDISPSESMDRDDDVSFAEDGGSHWFCAHVGVFLKGEAYDWEEIGSDYLGCCSYNSYREFYTDWRTSDDANRNTLANKDKGIVICHYFPDMVRDAIAEARGTIARRGALASSMRVSA